MGRLALTEAKSKLQSRGLAEWRFGMTARFPISGCAAVVGYFVAMMGIGVFAVKLSSVLATQAIALTEPYFLNNCSCVPSLVEQRLIAEQITAPPHTRSNENKSDSPGIAFDFDRCPCRTNGSGGAGRPTFYSPKLISLGRDVGDCRRRACNNPQNPFSLVCGARQSPPQVRAGVRVTSIGI
jgi:hypothetical protein